MKGKRRLLIAVVIIGITFLATSAWGAAGDQLWEVQLTVPTDFTSFRLTGLAVSSTAVIVCGYNYTVTDFSVSNPQLVSKAMGFVKAFDVATGRLKWEDYSTFELSSSFCYGIYLSGNTAIARWNALDLSTELYGYIPNMDGKYVFRAYNVDSGKILWDNYKPMHSNVLPTTSSLPSSSVQPVVSGNRIFSVLSYPTSLSPLPAYKTVLQAIQISNVANASSLLLLEQ